MKPWLLVLFVAAGSVAGFWLAQLLLAVAGVYPLGGFDITQVTAENLDETLIPAGRRLRLLQEVMIGPLIAVVSALVFWRLRAPTSILRSAVSVVPVAFMASFTIGRAPFLLLIYAVIHLGAHRLTLAASKAKGSEALGQPHT